MIPHCLPSVLSLRHLAWCMREVVQGLASYKWDRLCLLFLYCFCSMWNKARDFFLFNIYLILTCLGRVALSQTFFMNCTITYHWVVKWNTTTKYIITILLFVCSYVSHPLEQIHDRRCQGINLNNHTKVYNFASWLKVKFYTWYYKYFLNIFGQILCKF